ncbi:MAG: HypC/HybG/HupF family hydrogenase formation chaperone [Chromatiales bacterium]|nr:HypC/HybG/HupF family hydrogenase formation chaperone [Gammaproteobacteria bacterium]MBW6476793.1 HypC/HybG/HupF family hydrogenase formation chaperone [Chromatiales bacterium]
MCLAIPMRIEVMDGVQARCSAGGIEREVNLFMLQDQPLVIGDYVMVHVGYAIQKVDAELARQSQALHAQMQQG